MPPISAFIFDLDGVITDTAEYHYLAWQRLADEEGLPFSREDNEHLRGVSRRDSLLRLLKGRTLPEDTFEAWMKRKNDYYLGHLEQLTPADRLPGVTRFLEEAAAAGLKLGIGSASKNAHQVIARLGLAATFAVIGDGYAVAHSKPAPDLFIWVAGGLQVPVEEAVVFEDAAAGVDAARAAGCRTVGLGRAGIDHADLVLPDLATIPVAAVLAHFAARTTTHG
ncbi:MAG: beta-phosphoglucomutase [Anaerolineae bacterium]|nr:beta-phosphoglucomutase [Anaerolineae bacterium]